MIPFKRIALAVIVAIAPAEAVAGFLTAYAWAIGVLAGLWYFFTT